MIEILLSLAILLTYPMHPGPNKGTRLAWAQRDSNPRPTAPQAAILSKLNYEPENVSDDGVSTKYELTPNSLLLFAVQYYVLFSNDSKYLQEI